MEHAHLLLGEWSEQLIGVTPRDRSARGQLLAPGGGEVERVAAPVSGMRPPLHEPLVLELVEAGHQAAGVQPQAPAQVLLRTAFGERDVIEQREVLGPQPDRLQSLHETAGLGTPHSAEQMSGAHRQRRVWSRWHSVILSMNESSIERQIISDENTQVVAARARRLEVVAGHCEALGRSYDEIDKTVSTRLQPDESPDAFAERCGKLELLGFDHAVVLSAGPWTEEAVATLAAAS